MTQPVDAGGWGGGHAPVTTSATVDCDARVVKVVVDGSVLKLVVVRYADRTFDRERIRGNSTTEFDVEFDIDNPPDVIWVKTKRGDHRRPHRPRVDRHAIDTSHCEVGPVNEPPTITTPGNISAPEGTSGLIAVLTSTDPEGETDQGGGLTYSSSGADAALFALDPDSGAWTLPTGFDFENPMSSDGDNTYEVTFTVTDSGGLTDSNTVVYTVTDVSDSPPVVDDQLFNVDENTPNGASVGFVAFSDPDSGLGDIATLAVTGGSGAAAFGVDSGGEITVGDQTLLDFETTTTFSIEVQVSDLSGRAATATITIELIDVNEAPSLTVAAGVMVAENTIAVADADATDPDGETDNGGGLVYAVSGVDAMLFDIDSVGNLSFREAPDFENPADTDSDNLYDVTVTVTDSGGLQDSRALAITVEDVEEDTDADGLPDSADNCPTVPNADQLDQYGSDDGDACEDTDDDGILDVDEEHICVVVSIGTDPSNVQPPVVVLQQGTATCTVGDFASNYVFVVNGAGSSAQGGFMTDTIITIIGDNSHGQAGDSSGNRVTVIGNGSTARASIGGPHTASVFGDNGVAIARWGLRNVAISNGGCTAIAGGTSSLFQDWLSDQTVTC